MSAAPARAMFAPIWALAFLGTVRMGAFVVLRRDGDRHVVAGDLYIP
jgi:hypothetical protein